MEVRQKRSPKFAFFTAFCAPAYSGEERKRGSSPGRRKTVVRTAPVDGSSHTRETETMAAETAAGGSGRLRPHDWQPVRSTDRLEGLQLEFR